jgi:hypothetical protein
MTEAEWLRSTETIGMVQFLRGKASDRKLRLYACACAMWTCDQYTHQSYLAAVETAERFADGEATAEELAATRKPARRVSIDWARQHPDDPRMYNQIASADAASDCPFDAASTGSLDAGWSVSCGRLQLASPRYAALAELARDIFGNPFRPINLDLAWLTSTVLTLAQQMYYSRDFTAMPLLAEALKDAGCDNSVVLDHCRDAKGVHVRGCWLVDLILSKC